MLHQASWCHVNMHSHTCRELKLHTDAFNAWCLNMLKRTSITAVSPKLCSSRCQLHLKTQIPWFHSYLLSKNTKTNKKTKNQALCESTNLPSGESEPSDDALRRSVCGWRWSGRSSLSNAIMFHSCLRFRAFLTFFISRWRVLLSTHRFCSWEMWMEGQKIRWKLTF